MPITSEWCDDENRVIYVKYDGVWTLEDYYQNYEGNVQKITSVQHPVITILDFSTSGPLPSSFLSVRNHAQRTFPENNEQVIIFGVSGYIEAVAKLLQRLIPKLTKKIKFVSTREEALEAANVTLRV